MSESTKKHEMKIVIWNKNEKIIKYYTINSKTTIQDIINYLELKNVRMAFLGKNNYPFKLMPCNWSDFDDNCEADDFNVIVDDLLMSSPHNILNIEQYYDNNYYHKINNNYYKIVDLTEKERSELKEEIKEKFCYNEDFCNGHSIHLFLYNHKENDLCTVDDNEWAEKDWKLTSDESSLWLRLEKEFRTKEMNEKYDWTEATI
jgi:hypothetical protein